MSAAAVSETKSVLAEMTAQISGRKAAAGAKLTPVIGEAPLPLLPVLPLAFPNDHPQTVVLDAVREIRTQLAIAEAALVAVETLLGQAQAAAPAVDTQKAKERAADEKAAARIQANDHEAEYDAALAADMKASLDTIAAAPTMDEAVDEVARFNAEFNAKSAAAQAATYRYEGVATIPTEAAEWQCPVHHAATELTSRKGRKYLACPQYPDACDQFERLAA